MYENMTAVNATAAMSKTAALRMRGDDVAPPSPPALAVVHDSFVSAGNAFAEALSRLNGVCERIGAPHFSSPTSDGEARDKEPGAAGALREHSADLLVRVQQLHYLVSRLERVV